MKTAEETLKELIGELVIAKILLQTQVATLEAELASLQAPKDDTVVQQ